MKRRLALFLLVCLLLPVLPCSAEEFIGNMEVVNCAEWVSLREAPSTSAPRQVKVSLGAIVRNCRTYDSTWIYAEYDGYSGYILAEYLRPSEGITTFSAMLVTNCEQGTYCYATPEDDTPIDFIPVNTVVRNCILYDGAWVYVEYGGRSGFVPYEHVTYYSELLHYPQKLTLSCSMYGTEDAAEAALRGVWEESITLPEGGYDVYTQEDTGAPRAEFVLYTETEVSNLQLFSLEMLSFDDESGVMQFTATLEYIQPLLSAERPLLAAMTIHGLLPSLAVGYMDALGVYHFAFVEISGEDGGLLLLEF